MKTSRTLTTSHLAHRPVLAGVAFILTLAILSPAIYAANVTWSGGGGNGSWATGANWGGSAPVASDTLFFSGTSQTITINDLAAGTTYGGINFTNDGSAGKTGNFTLSGNSINPGSAAQDIVTTATTSGTLTDTISLTMNLTASKIIKVGAGHNLIISGNILNASGSRSLTKSGTASTGGGMLTLSGNNTYTGGTTISMGTINIGHANALGTTGNITFSGGALQYGSGITVDLSGRIKNSTSAMLIDTNGQSVSFDSVLDSSNSAGLTKTGSGTLTLNASNTYTGNSTISAGTLQIGNANALGTSGNITFGGGALQYGSGITVDLSGRIKNSGSAMLIDTNGQSVTFASILDSSNSGGLTKNGSGTLTLNASNTYTGATAINAGTLSIAAITNGGVAGALGNSTNAAANLVLGGGTLLYTGSNGSTDRNFTLSNATTSVIDVSSAGTTLTISGTATTTTGGLTKNGSGTLLLAGSNNYTGDTTVNSGILQIGANNRISDSSTLRVNGGTFNMATFNDTVAGVILSANGTISGTNPILTSNSDFILENGTAAAILAGTVGVNKTTSGTVILSAANTYTGATTINAGTLQIGNGGTTGALSSSSAITNNGTLTFNRSNAITQGTNFASGISGTGNVTQAGTGTLTFNGTNSYTGTTTISAGTLALNSSASNNSTISGNIVINGGTLNYGSAINEQISNAATVTMTSGSFVLAGRDETIGSISMSGGDLSMASGALTLSSTSSFTGGNISITAAGGRINTASSGPTTVGNATFSYNVSSGATQGLILSSGLFVNASTIANFTNVSSGVGQIKLNGATRTIDVDTGATMNVGWIISGTGDGLTKNGTGTLNLSSANTYTGATTINAGILQLSGAGTIGSGAFSITGGELNLGGVNLTNTFTSLTGGTLSNGTITNNGSIYGLQSGTVSAVLAGTNGFNKTTAGTVILNASNTYAGISTITAGTLQIGHANALGTSGNITFGGGTLQYGSGITVDLSGRIKNSASAILIDTNGQSVSFDSVLDSTNSGGLAKNGSGTLNLNASNTYSGTTIVNVGTLSIGNVNALQNTTLDTGTSGSQAVAFSAAGANTYNIGAIQGGDTLDFGSNTISVGANNAATSFTGILAGSGGSLTKVGSGVLTLSGNNSYTGVTTISAGTLRLNNAASNTTTISGNILINGGTLNYGTTDMDDQISNSATVTMSSGSIALSGRTETIGSMSMSGGSLSIAGGVLTLSSASSFTGGNVSITIAGGGLITTGQTTLGNATFSYSNASNNASQGLVLSSGLDLNANTTANFTNALAGVGRISLGGTTKVFDVGASSNLNIGWAVVSSNSSGGLTKNGTGTMTLSAANTYTGATTINGGTLTLSGGSAIADTGAVTVASGAVLNLGASETVGAISGAGNIAMGSYTLTSNASTATSFTGILSGSGGSLTKVGSGSLTLSGANTYTGSTTISAGTLVLNGTNSNSAITVNSGGTLAGSGTGGATTINSGGKIGPGNSPGILTVGNLTLNGGATYSWEMADATGSAGAGWDQINATGLLTIGSNATSTFTIAITSSGNPSNWIYTTSNQSWDIIDYGTINGFNASYFTLNTSAFQGDLDAQSSAWALTDTGSTLRLTYTYTANTPTYTGGTGNWSTGFSPAITTGGNATFAGLGGTATNDIASATLSSIGGLTFDGINSYTLGANSGSAGYNSASALAIGGGVTNNSTVTQTINVATSFAANQTIAGNTGSLVFGGNVAVAANATLTVLGNSSTTISGVVSGAGALTKNSNSTLTLSGNNTYSGGTTITTGTVLVGHDKAFGTGILRLGGTIASTDGTDRTISNNVGGLSGTWTYTFGQAIGGTGNLTFTDTGTATFASTGSKTFNVLNTTSFASSLISTGNVTVSKIGAGTLILTGNSTYSGSTTINAGTLQIGNGGTSGALSASSTITNNGTLAFKRSNTITQGTDFANSISGTGNLTQAGSGTLVLGGTNTYTGATTISAGTLSLSTATALSATSGVNLANSTTLAYTGSAATFDRLISVTSGTGTIRNSGSGLLTLSGGLSKNGTTLTLAGGSNGITVSGVISGSANNSDLIIDGGTTTLTNANNSYNGPTFIINSGTLNANTAGALPTSTLTDVTINGSSTLALGTSQSLASLSGTSGSTVNLNANTLTINGSATTTYSGGISGTGNLVKNGSGTQTLAGATTFNGTTTINSGTLQAATANALANTSQVVLNNGGSFLVTADDAIGTNTDIELNGGTLAFGAAGYDGYVGALTLSANSTIDLGTSSNGVLLRFTNINWNNPNALLSIYNWTGNTEYSGNPGGGLDQVVIGNATTTALSTSQLQQIHFYSGIEQSSFIANAFQITSGTYNREIIAVPETETYFYAVALLAGLVVQYLRRRARRKPLGGSSSRMTQISSTEGL